MSNPLYFVEREYPVELETLWNAWVKAESLEKWYSPTFLEVIPGSATSDVAIGGEWAIAVDVSANGFNAYFWGSYSEIREQELLIHSLNYSQDELEFLARIEQPDAHRIEISFERRQSGSWVRFSQFGEMDQEQAEASREGMESYFDNLGLFLEAR